MSVSTTQRLFLFLALLVLLAFPAMADNVTISGNVTFASLDGSSLDHDGVANGTFTVSDGDLTVLGSINCNDDATRDACNMNFAVSGNLTVAAGGALYAENRKGNGVGGSITANVGGNFVLGGTISSGNLSVDRAGDITVTAGGSALLQAGSVVSGSSKGSPAGNITIQSGGLMDLRGLVAAGPSSTVVSTKYTGAVLNGGSSNSAGGAITLRSTSHTEPAISVASTAVIVSQGENAGAGAVILQGCGIVVNGLVASVATSGAGAKVILRSGTTASVDGRDLGASGTRLGMLRADSIDQGAGTYSANIFARNNVTVQGPASGSLYAVNSSGGRTSKDPSGTVNVIATAGSVTASGNAFAATGSSSGDQGGTINVSARDNVVLTGANINASGDFSTSDSSRKGGAINVRSYSGAVTWLTGTGDVRPVGSAAGVPAAQQGTITITYCTAVSTTGTSFPTNGSPVGTFPTVTQSCSPAAPPLPSGESHPDCNAPPIAVNDAYTVAEAGTLNVAAPGVLGNDTDPDGNPITAILVSGPAHAASFSFNADGSFNYVHDGSETTSDSFTYKANDGSLDSNVATVTITITAVNDPPVANNDFYTVAEGGTLNVLAPGVKANDTDPDGPVGIVSVVTGPAHAASFVLNPDGSFTYVHDGSETTSDSFVYQLSDGTLSSNATVSITITAVNDPPVAANDGPYTVGFHQSITIPPPGVLGNDTDADSPTITAVLVANVTQGTLALNPNGGFTYTHTGATLGTDSFTYQASDGSALSNVATVTINIVNIAPVANADSFNAVGNTELRVGTGATVTPALVTAGSVLTNDSDPDNGPAPLTVNAFDATSFNGGTVSMNPNGTFNYLPPTGFTGTDSFNYSISDGQATATATVTITVTNRVWYVNVAAGVTQTGRSTEPFATLAQAEIASAVSDNIHVAQGTYTSGILLKNSQRLIGSGVPLVVGPYTLAPATVRPIIGGSITLASGDLVTGLNVSVASSAGITGTLVSGGTIEKVDVTGGFEALTLMTASGTFTITDVRLVPSGAGLTISGGTATVNASNLDVVTTTGTGIFGDAGTLNISAGADGSTVSASGGTAVNLSNMTLGVALLSVSANGGTNAVNLSNTAGSFAVTGSGAAGSGGTIQNTTGVAVNAVNAAGISLRSVNINNSALQGVFVQNNLVGASSLAVENSSFSGNFSNAVQTINSNTGAMTVNAIGNTFANNNAAVVLQTTKGPLTTKIQNNVATFNQGTAFVVTRSPGGNSLVEATITGNTVGASGVPNSGAVCGGGCGGFSVTAIGTNAFNLLLDSNTVHQIDSTGIRIFAQQGSSSLAATITNNRVDEPVLPDAAEGIHVQSGAVSADTTSVCAQISGNTVTGGYPIDIFVRNNSAGSTFSLPGYAGLGTDTTAVANFIKANNTVTTVLAQRKTSAPANQFSGGPTCTLPAP